ncbi:MAG: arsenate reductase (glutaredoxin) [Rhizobiaceae bacterium]
MTVTIYHNPKCGTSRTTLALLEDAGLNPTIIEYLKSPLSRKELEMLVKKMPTTVRELVRTSGDIYKELGLSDESLTDEQLIDAMIAHPILMQRPVVETSKGVRMCRPSTTVNEIL